MRQLGKIVALSLLAMVGTQVFDWKSDLGFARVLATIFGFIVAVVYIVLPDNFEF